MPLWHDRPPGPPAPEPIGAPPMMAGEAPHTSWAASSLGRLRWSSRPCISSSPWINIGRFWGFSCTSAFLSLALSFSCMLSIARSRLGARLTMALLLSCVSTRICEPPFSRGSLCSVPQLPHP